MSSLPLSTDGKYSFRSRILFSGKYLSSARDRTANLFSYRSGHHIISVEGHIIESHPSSAVTSGDPSQRAQSIFGVWSIFSLLVVLFTHS